GLMTKEEKRAYDKLYYQRNKKKKDAQAREWYVKNFSTQVRDYHLKKNFGITLEQFESMLEAQGGGCAICGGLPGGRGNFHVDHNHVTGEIRGLLCHYCNVTLGNMKDSPELLEKAAAYLRSKRV